MSARWTCISGGCTVRGAGYALDDRFAKVDQ